MSTAKANFFSTLTRQYLLLQDGFAARYPHDWLVWEAGEWSPPEDPAGTAKTRLPNRLPTRPKRGDAMCFELLAQPGQQVHVGRAPENDLVLDDATVSPHQLVIDRVTSYRWIAASVPGSTPTHVLGAPLPDNALPLTSGLMLRIGDLVLSFQTSASLTELVKAAAAQLL